MGLIFGLDLGSVSIKWAAAAPLQDEELFRALLAGGAGFDPVPAALSQPLGLHLAVSRYQRILGNPTLCLTESLEALYRAIPRSAIAAMRFTGAGARLASTITGASAENEFTSIACGVARLYPAVRTVLEIGGESSKYIRLDATNGDAGHAAAVIADYSTSGECAAGTGSFLDQQASRLLYQVEQIGEVVSEAKRAAQIAGRCSVFAKSDMINAQQRGYSTGEVLKGLCEAVARNFKSNIVKGKPVIPQIALIGAVSQNAGVVAALREAFHLGAEDLFVPELYAWLGAIGCALRALDETRHPAPSRAASPEQSRTEAAPPRESVSLPPLSLDGVLLLRNRPQTPLADLLPARGEEKIPAWMGIDVGSVSTNLAVLDEQGRLLHQIYLRTSGRPIEVVSDGLREIQSLLGEHIEICGVGTTGSGRELIGELVGADTVNDEITAHKTGALFVHHHMVRGCAPGAAPRDSADGAVDTIFEIGGQDSKFISIDHGVVVDFAMNEACAAGTGSFLEEQAERMGISIKEEFARLALASQAPVRLGERCTVFMERDVTAWMQRGAKLEDLAAGLAYSIALNYLHRVVRNRRIGKVIYFQGGTAYNDAVAAAFSQILGRQIIVPPHNGVIGAIGMALIAQELCREKPAPLALAAVAGGSGRGVISERAASASAFRGYDLNRTRYEVREFTCKACSNFCEMKQIRVDGRKTYWGDKCSDKFRKPARSCRQPVIPDLLALRDQLLLGGSHARENPSSPAGASLPRIGIPRAMYFYDRFPFWRRYLEELGFAVVVSRPVERQSSDFTVAEPCFPVQVAHGHVHALFNGCAGEPPADYVLLPNVLDHESPNSGVASYLCPWNQTLPFVIRAAPVFAAHAARILAPTIYFRLGPDHVKKQLGDYFARLGVRRRTSDAAVDAAYAEQASFTEQLLDAGRAATQTIQHSAEPAVLLVGRPYNIYDRNGNCDIPRKLRSLYGVNVLPMDFLPLDELPIDDLHPSMFWNSGRRILAAGLLARGNPRLHIIYLTNFKCGPDSFIKHFLREAAGAPYLVLQFDGHGNDAGYLTRCEAFLDSKGVLRCPLPS
ncbi:MAG: acyl-CoA dehydratase activase [Acidobacteriia bacterium]|nr:acyl-CoA dehydratase activase [Terriglobia bacterium]